VTFSAHPFWDVRLALFLLAISVSFTEADGRLIAKAMTIRAKAAK